jgi:hypothetical protein
MGFVLFEYILPLHKINKQKSGKEGDQSINKGRLFHFRTFDDSSRDK